MWRHSPHHTHARCGEISDLSTFITHRNLKFLHMTIFSPHVWQVVHVTNMRYFSSFAFLYLCMFVFLCKVEAKPGRGCTSNGGLLRALASLLFRTASPARHYFALFCNFCSQHCTAMNNFDQHLSALHCFQLSYDSEKA